MALYGQKSCRILIRINSSSQNHDLSGRTDCTSPATMTFKNSLRLHCDQFWPRAHAPTVGGSAFVSRTISRPYRNLSLQGQVLLYLVVEVLPVLVPTQPSPCPPYTSGPCGPPISHHLPP